MRLFFFGTLMDVDLLALVLDRPVGDSRPRPARLRGYVRHRAAGESFPFLKPEPQGVVEGTVVEGLSEADVARLNFFEDEDEYRLYPIEVEDDTGWPMTAHVFLSTLKIRDSLEPWDHAAWARDEKPLTLLWAAEYMGYYGKLSCAEVDALWPDIKDRAEIRLAEMTANGLHTGSRRGHG
ncbi:gamma-glutamylcyclotransferase family protein [Roseospirillum parvum]|uniref:Putative gamma-glutamylcyclotransferase n=1 Tax=Roseospirillum parvum TaxID=83401 RepID=A0A1G8D4N5_9PROT|nr:gamma-glutamylcyclotransferase family protein [Roseospirillum parvum]SDH52170.1 Gamma-glutamyl cyclotransferase, AIG2-like [Roseospirillum parvum]